MFARVKKSIISAPSSGNSGRSQQQQQHGGSFANGNNNQHNHNNASKRNNNKTTMEDEHHNAKVLLEELQTALARLESLTERVSIANHQQQQQQQQHQRTGRENGTTTARRSSVATTTTPKKSKVQEDTIAVGNSNSNSPTKTPSHNNNNSHNYNDNNEGEEDAKFIIMDKHDESEMVELLRRIAELVILSERKASQLMNASSRGRTFSNEDDNGDNGGDGDGDGAEGNTTKKQQEEDRMMKIMYENEELSLPYLALFDLFCEKNALANIVNIVTGKAFVMKQNDNVQLLEGNNNNEVLQTPKRQQQQRKGIHNLISSNVESTPATTPSSKTPLAKNASTTTLSSSLSISATKTIHLLPPLTIATQAIQSVSILIQNVSRPTTLYFLLSNNRVNDLIKLPLHLYKCAEKNALLDLHYSKWSSSPPSSLYNYVSPEMGEVTTHFVSFLKSLAMRVNRETLQFFLSFPLGETMSSSMLMDDDDDDNDDDARKLMEGSSDTAIMEAASAAVTVEPVADTATEEEPTSSSEATTETPNSDSMQAETTAAKTGTTQSQHQQCQKPRQKLTYLQKRRVVEFPLYARALEFCALEQDSFVRVTAMNVCMNIIRLASRDGGDGNVDVQDKDGCDDDNDDDDGDHKKDDATTNDAHRENLPTTTPTGDLHEAPTLPLQDRIAIAQYACDPNRVSDLIAPLCARLTSQFGQVEGTVRALEELGCSSTSASKSTTRSQSLSSSSSTSKNKTQKNPTAEKRQRLTNTIRDLMANVQDELLLLDDLLKVGLISLNEQAIEMMLATFVYPMLLQPLLLPLHRFSSSKKQIQQHTSLLQSASSKEQQLLQTPKRLHKPTITLKSPPPFSAQSKEIKHSHSESESSVSNDSSNSAPSSTPAPSSVSPNSADNANGIPTTHSSQDMDLAPSKTALFGLSVIFHTISNPTLRRLILTALLHPLSPEASGGIVIHAPPQVTVPSKKKTQMGSPRSGSSDIQLEIRMEGNHFKQSKPSEACLQNVSVYNFGTISYSENEKEACNIEEEDDTNKCIFILAPGLVDMLQNNPGSSGDMKTTRPNPYRKVIFSSIAGSEEMASLQSLAIAALHAAVSSVDGWTIQKILFACSNNNNVHKSMLVKEDEKNTVSSTSQLGSSMEPDRECKSPKSHNDTATDTLECLCKSIVNKSVTYDGWWKVKFNGVAARTLMDIICDNFDFLVLVDTFMSEIRLEAANFLMMLPSLLDAKSRESNPIDSNHLDAWLIDRFYFDQADKSSTSVVEKLCYLKEHVEGDGSKSQYRYGLEVLSRSSITDATTLLCEDSLVVDNMVVSKSTKDTPFVCAASWALECLALDAFSTKVSKMLAKFEDQKEAGSTTKPTLQGLMRRLSYVSEASDDDSFGKRVSYSLAHVSSKFSIAMLDEGEASESKKGDAEPAHGSVVGLVGRACFPCVCEISPSFASLFTGRTCVSNDGISWQSLYLVVVGKWVVLAEPDRGGSGGEGRVITACRLACLAIKKDTSMINNDTPARRLLVAHSSLDPRPPALFSQDLNPSRRLPNLGPDGLRLTRSRMDLWFEDSNAAGHAWKVLSGKIARARAKRGARIRSALLAP